MASPPVVRFLDFGQYKYELTKREKEAKRKQRSVTFKEVRLSPKIGIGDFDTKVNRAVEFLEDGDRIKVTVRFRGRELTHPELGRNLLARFTDRVKDHGLAERTPLLEGKSMHITMASIHKPKGHDAPATKGGDAGESRGPASPAPLGATGQLISPAPVAAPVPPAPVAAPVAAPDPVATSDPAAAPKAILVEAPKAVPSDAPPAASPAAASPAGDASPAAPSSAEVNPSEPKPPRATAAVSAKPRAIRTPAKSGTAAEPGDADADAVTRSAAPPRATRTTKARTPAPEPVATGE